MGVLEERFIDEIRQLRAKIADLESSDRVAAVVARYTTATAQSIANAVASAIVNYGTQVIDTATAVSTPTTAWRFTAPLSGYYHVGASVMLAGSTGWTAGEAAHLDFFKNGTLWSNIDRDDEMAGTSTQYKRLAGSDIVYLAKGDYCDVRVNQSSGAALTLHPDTAFNYIAIHKIN